jgi:hypothetical protein
MVLRTGHFEKKFRNTLKICFWRRMEKINWTGHVRNEEVLRRVKEERNILQKKKGRLTDLVTFCVEIAF